MRRPRAREAAATTKPATAKGQPRTKLARSAAGRARLVRGTRGPGRPASALQPARSRGRGPAARGPRAWRRGAQMRRRAVDVEAPQTRRARRCRSAGQRPGASRKIWLLDACSDDSQPVEGEADGEGRTARTRPGASGASGSARGRRRPRRKRGATRRLPKLQRLCFGRPCCNYPNKSRRLGTRQPLRLPHHGVIVIVVVGCSGACFAACGI